MSYPPFVILQRGNKLLQLHRYKQAIEEFSKGIMPDRNNAAFYLRIAFCYNELDNHEKAIEFANKTLAEEPNNSFAFFVKARISQKRKNYVMMREHILKALEFDNNRAYYYAMLAETYLATNDLKKADEILNRGLEINPNDTECLTGMLKVVSKNENEEKIMNAALRLATADPSSDYVHEVLGWAYLRIKKYDKSKYHYREALRLNPMRPGLEARLDTVDIIQSVNGDKEFTWEDFVFTATVFISIVAFVRIALDFIIEIK